MHTVNHIAVGAGIALITKQPALALPLALLSHYVLDALPHYGVQGDEGYATLFKSKRTVIMLTLDVVGALFLIYILRSQPWYVYGAMFMSVVPDSIWLYRYFWFERHGKEPPPAGPITRFHQRIQWAERSWGIFIEIPVAAVLYYLVWRAV